MIKHSIEDLQEMVSWCRDRRRNPAHWLEMLAAARLQQLRIEVRESQKKEREAKRAAVSA